VPASDKAAAADANRIEPSGPIVMAPYNGSSLEDSLKDRQRDRIGRRLQPIHVRHERRVLLRRVFTVLRSALRGAV
jgi:hypothetical protein